AAGPYALELARDLREHHGGGLSDPEKAAAAGRHGAVRHLGARETEVDLVLRLFGRGLPRGAPAVVLRRRISPMPVRRPRLPRHPTTTSCIAASTCEIRQSRSRSAAGGCRARVKAPTSRRRRGIRWTRATAPTTPTSIPSAATAAISPISTAACSSSTFPTRR